MKVVLSIVYATLLILSTVHGSFITLQSTITTSADIVEAALVNKGDEPAYNVDITLITPLSRETARIDDRLDVEETSKHTFNLNLEDIKPSGTYPLILAIGYSDANNYPFSAITLSTLGKDVQTTSKVLTSLEEVELDKKAVLKVKVKNLDAKEKDITIKVVTPTELFVGEEAKNVHLDPYGEDIVKFVLQNKAALPESTYALFALAEYDEENRHYTSIAGSSAKVTAASSLFSIKFLLIPLALLLIVLAIISYKKK